MSAATQNTRARILRSAEKLFARHGIDQTSIRLINQTAGQRNSSATQYHFGNKAGLITAIFDWRMEAINARRLEMLEALTEQRGQTELRSLVEILVNPLAEHLRHGSNGYYYILLAAQVIGHPAYHEIGKTRKVHGTGLQRLIQLLQARLVDLPEEIFVQRFGMSLRQVFSELADYQRLYLSRPVAPRPDMPLFISNLVDVVTAQFTAPVSRETRHELENVQRESA